MIPTLNENQIATLQNAFSFIARLCIAGMYITSGTLMAINFYPSTVSLFHVYLFPYGFLALPLAVLFVGAKLVGAFLILTNRHFIKGCVLLSIITVVMIYTYGYLPITHVDKLSDLLGKDLSVLRYIGYQMTILGLLFYITVSKMR